MITTDVRQLISQQQAPADHARFLVKSRLIRVTTIGLMTISLMFSRSLVKADEDIVAVQETSDVQDLLFCAARRPFLIRLHLLVNGKSFHEPRRRWADALFNALDKDRNGLLEGDEISGLPSAGSLQNDASAETPTGLQPDTAPVDGKISLDECRNYLLAAAATPFSIATRVNDVQVNLFPKLDVNQDGVFSRDEIAGAGQKLRRYDLNEDDVVSAGELQQGMATEQAAADQNMSGILRFLVVVESAERGLANSRRLLELYDKASRDPSTRTFRRDERLSRTELLIEPDAFDRADGNHDGQLDRKELSRLSSAMPPSVELAIEAPSTTGKFTIKSLRPNDQTLAPMIELKQEAGERLLLLLNGVAFSLGAAGAPANMEQQVRTTYAAQFQNLDQDKNDYLDLVEMRRFGFMETFFTQADSDSNGKLFENEYLAQVDREIELSKTGFVLEIGGDGRSLFRMLDTNPADNRLSLRELADAPARMTQFDSDGDGILSLKELSIALNGVFRAGTPRVNGPFTNRQPQFNPVSGRPRAAAAQTESPSWFVKMDRNNDGDLSPKEFLGRRALFDKIDQNQDGLISAAEATAVPQ